MFSQLFFVLLILTLITFTPETASTFWIIEPLEAFKWGMTLYFALLVLFYVESRYLAHSFKNLFKGIWWSFINLQLLIFFCVFHFALGAQRVFFENEDPSFQTPFVLFSLFLYFFALGWAHYWFNRFQFHHRAKTAFQKAYQQILFFLPFCLPFVLITLVLDALEQLPVWRENTFFFSHDILLSIISLCLLILTFIFLPVCMIIFWQCRPLLNSDLKEHLERLCQSLNFRHAGLKIWTAMSDSYTAGIVGFVPKFRYILFTTALLKHFQREEIEAILVHEIGHNRYRHLLIYPFIMFGMLLVGTILLIISEIGLNHLLGDLSSQTTHFALFMMLFFVYSIGLALYFRFIFGFFSRLFERQADLYIFETPLSPIYLVQALDHLGVVTGNTHTHPSWHHFSIQKRIEFLQQAMENPQVIDQHHRKVKKWLIIYFLSLYLCCMVLYLLFNLQFINIYFIHFVSFSFNFL